MAKYYYKKGKGLKRLGKFASLGILLAGALLFGYTFFPVISWQVYFAPAFASQKIDAPIPTNKIISPASIGNLLSNARSSLGTDYTNAYNWYPGASRGSKKIGSYKLSIPKIGIENAHVSNQDSDLTKHLVQFNTDSIPPKEGNSVIFGHSTLPQLYNPKDYKTIFANAYKLEVGDKILIDIANYKYSYKIESIVVVDPEDTSVLAQNFSDSFITIVTCTPPGTVWKRLVIKARIEAL
jgi:sortase A